MNKQAVFRCIALLIPIVFFGVLEFTLRLIGIGESRPLFIENPAHTDYILPRPDILSRYFPDQTERPSVSMEANFLLKQKPENGLRIFVQGGSTAAGYPYGLGASLAGMLDHRLKRSLPDHQVEVINTAMSAVNSFTLLDLADEIIAQQPDAVLIYAGHNEYLGILGAGSRFTIGSGYWLTRIMLYLKDFHLYQAIRSLIYTVNSQTSAQRVDETSRTVMSQVAKHKNIPYDSNLFKDGITQFERNMQAVLTKYKAAGIPVFIATIASNLRDHAPFNSNEVAPALTQKLAAARSADELRALANQYSTVDSAEFHFQLATKLLVRDQSQLARKHFNLAKQHDLLRFRAPSEINQVIKRLAKQDHVYLVEVERRMRERSDAGIIGRNIMLEHLHPNVQGYFLLADTFYQQLKSSQLFYPFIEVSTNDAWRMRPILPAEEYFGYASIVTLMSDYPFTDSPQPIKLPTPRDWQQELGMQLFRKDIDWLRMATLSAERYRDEKKLDMWFKTLQLIADATPHDPVSNATVGEQFYQQQRFSEATYYLQRAKRAGWINTKSYSQILVE